MIAENKAFLENFNPDLIKYLETAKINQAGKQIGVLETRSGDFTLQINTEGRSQLIHSKYDPKKEASRIIDDLADEVSEYEHVLFYGLGMGYHIEEFMNRYPEYYVSVYEPCPEIFYHYASVKNITNLPTRRLSNIFVENSQEDGKRFLESLILNLQERILLIILPSYAQIFKEEFKRFSAAFKEAVEAKRHAYHVDNLFSARWTLNSLINFSKTVQTPNILSEEFKNHFKNKPLIIVAAGPSLEEEYENLRYIKKNKLAYIFAVGSANRALIAQDIMPDAVCTYDPQAHNPKVFISMIEKGIESIPMIFGTSVGFETLDLYKGPKLHMVTSQDTISEHYLKNADGSPIDIVDDAPTIAAVTFQLGAKLGCNPIVFVGQNLAFRNNQYYSKDVEYKKRNRTIAVREKDRIGTKWVKSVEGEEVETNASFISMKEFIEFQINRYPEVEVINTTIGGAHIEGSAFFSLEQLMKERFQEPVVEKNWYTLCENHYDKDYAIERIRRMERSIDDFRKNYRDIMYIMEEMNKNIATRKEMKLAKNIIKFDKLMKKLVLNESYICYIQPVNRSQFQALSIRAANIRKQANDIERARLIIDSFTPYLQRCKATLEQIVGTIYMVHGNLLKENQKKESKYYPSNCGVFQFEGMWEKQNYSAGKNINPSLEQHIAKKQHSKVCFRFKGSTLKIYGSKRRDGSGKIQIKIDDMVETFSEKYFAFDTENTPRLNELVYEKKGLAFQEHVIEISVLDDGIFFFSGIEIDKEGRAYHVHEVTKIEDLEVGKRIRCHYNAVFNKVGEFNGLGEETKEFIPPQSSAYPDGDFYFIMVDEVNGGKKLIADRNVQHSISWNSIHQEKIATNDGKRILNDYEHGIFVRLMTGGSSPEDKNNEWDQYLVNPITNDFKKDDIDNWNCSLNDSLFSWTLSKSLTYENRRIRRSLGNIKYLDTKWSEIDFVAYNSGFRPLISIDNLKTITN